MKRYDSFESDQTGTALLELALVIPFLGLLFISVATALNYTSAYVDLQGVTANIATLSLDTGGYAKEGEMVGTEAIPDSEATRVAAFIEDNLKKLGYDDATTQYYINVLPVTVRIQDDYSDTSGKYLGVHDVQGAVIPNTPIAIGNAGLVSGNQSLANIASDYFGNSDVTRVGYDFLPVRLSTSQTSSGADADRYGDFRMGKPFVATYQTVYYYSVAIKPSFALPGALATWFPRLGSVSTTGMVMATRQFPLTRKPEGATDLPDPADIPSSSGGSGGGSSSGGADPGRPIEGMRTQADAVLGRVDTIYAPSNNVDDARFVSLCYRRTPCTGENCSGDSVVLDTLEPCFSTALTGSGSEHGEGQQVCSSAPLGFIKPTNADSGDSMSGAPWYAEMISRVKRFGPPPALGAFIAPGGEAGTCANSVTPPVSIGDPVTVTAGEALPDGSDGIEEQEEEIIPDMNGSEGSDGLTEDPSTTTVSTTSTTSTVTTTTASTTSVTSTTSIYSGSSSGDGDQPEKDELTPYLPVDSFPWGNPV